MGSPFSSITTVGIMIYVLYHWITRLTVQISTESQNEANHPSEHSSWAKLSKAETLRALLNRLQKVGAQLVIGLQIGYDN